MCTLPYDPAGFLSFVQLTKLLFCIQILFLTFISFPYLMHVTMSLLPKIFGNNTDTNYLVISYCLISSLTQFPAIPCPSSKVFLARPFQEKACKGMGIQIYVGTKALAKYWFITFEFIPAINWHYAYLGNSQGTTMLC